MKTVGFVTSPLTTGHATRGVGFYTKRLLTSLKSQASSHNIEIIEDNLSADLVHYPFFDLFIHSLPLFKKKTIVTVHDVIPLEFPEHYPIGVKGRINLKLQKLALNGVESVITDSQASKKSIINYLNYPKAKIQVVYLAADEKFKPITDNKLLNIVKDKFHLPDKYVLYVGDINWNKNIPGLVRACKLAHLPLVIVGKNAANIESLDLNHSELRHLRGVDWISVQRLGFVSDDDLVAVYNLASVYCQPSFAEGFGLGVLEALACETPVACSSAHSLPEVGGEAVTYFDPHNISQMSQAILNAKQAEGILQVQKFSWEKTAQETIMIYADVLTKT